jgi:hypothetical protein
MSANTDLCNLLEQRTMRLQLTGPPVRYNPISPYPAYTPTELDMRRKAEILQYNKNASKGSKLTKAQKYAGAMNQRKSGIVQPACIYGPNNLYKPTPTSSSDVPGPVIMLYYDPSVPLYKFANNVDNHGAIDKDIAGKWSYYFSPDMQNQTGVETILANMVIENIDEYTTPITITVPIGIYINGTSTSGPGNVYINSVGVAIYYNNVAIDIGIPTVTIDGFANISSRSVNYSINDAPFSGVKYIGNLIVSNLNLPTQSGYVYEIRLTFNMTASSTVNAGVFANVSSDNNMSVNCTMTNTVSVLARKEASIM